MSQKLKRGSKPSSPKDRLEKYVGLIPDLLDVWEKKHPDWRLESLFWILEWSLNSLRHYVESDDDSLVSWQSPHVELHFPVECTWEESEEHGSVFRVNSGNLSAEEMGSDDEAAKAVSKVMVRHLQIVALQELTNYTAFEKQGEEFIPRLDPETVEHVRATLPESSHQIEFERLFRPKSFGGGSIDVSDLEEGAAISEEALAQLTSIEEPLLELPVELNGRELRVITVFEVHPLIAEADSKVAYFPIVVGLALQAVEDDEINAGDDPELDWADFNHWSSELRNDLWAAFSDLIKASLETLGPPPDPAMQEAVISVNAQIKVAAPSNDAKRINEAISNLLEHFKETGEILSFSAHKVSCHLSSQPKEEFLSLLNDVERAITANAKGVSLEKLVAALFRSVVGFSVRERARTESEEIDLWIINECDTRPFRDEGDVMLVECKNWSGKCGKNEFVSIYHKAQNRAGRCTLAFLVSWNGFADTTTTEMLRSSRENILVVPIDGERIKEAVHSGDLLKMLSEARQRALMV